MQNSPLASSGAESSWDASYVVSKICLTSQVLPGQKHSGNAEFPASSGACPSWTVRATPARIRPFVHLSFSIPSS